MKNSWATIRTRKEILAGKNITVKTIKNEGTAHKAVSSGWTHQRGGDIANKYGFNGLQDEAAYEAASLIEQGRIVLTVRTLAVRLDIGRIGTKLKDILGTTKFWVVIEEHWFDNDNIKNKRRDLELSMQMYIFSTGAGSYIRKDIPIESYIQIMRAAEVIEDKKEKKRFLKRIAKTGRFEGVDLGNTKKVREKCQEIKNEIINGDDEELKTKLHLKAVRELVYTVDYQTKKICDRVTSFLFGITDSQLQELEKQEHVDKLKIALSSVHSSIETILKKTKNKKIDSKKVVYDE